MTELYRNIYDQEDRNIARAKFDLRIAENKWQRDTQIEGLWKFRNFLLLRNIRTKFRLSFRTPIAREKDILQIWRRNLELHRRTLREIKIEVESWNGKVFFVYFPSFRNLQGKKDKLNLQHEIEDAVRSEGIMVIPIREDMIENEKPRRLFPELIGRYNALGYSIVANAVARKLLDFD